MTGKISRTFQYLILISVLGFYLNSELVMKLLKPDHLSPQLSKIVLDLPLFILGIGALTAAHFNRTQVTFINICLGTTYFLVSSIIRKASFVVPGFLELFFHVLSIIFTVMLVFFHFSQEKGLFSRSGILKIFAVFSCYSAAVWAFRGGLNLTQFTDKFSFITSHDPFFHISLPALVFTVTGIFMFTVSHFRSGKNTCRYSLILSAVIFLALNWDSPWNAGKKELYRLTVFFSFSGLLMILYLYNLTWGRVFTDELTGLFNRRALDESLPKLSTKFSVCMIDIDHFKKFNDTYGHQSGDEVLVFVSGFLKNCGFGTAYRYGGEEFCIISTGRECEMIINEVENLRRTIESASLVLMKTKNPKFYGKRVSVTASIGMAQSTEAFPDPVEVIKCADAALYRAKKKGRNRVEMEKRKFKR